MRFISSENWQKGSLVFRFLLLGLATICSFSVSASQARLPLRLACFLAYASSSPSLDSLQG